MDIGVIIRLIAGFVLLVIGAEALVRGAARLAAAAGISPLIVGLTVVAFATGAPEMLVSAQAAFRGQADIALGNVVGSNIFNLLFVLGASALVLPLVVKQRLVRLDAPLMVGVSVLVFALGLDGRIGRWEGALLLAGAIAYTLFLIRQSRKESLAVEEAYAHEFGAVHHRGGWLIDVLLIVAGLALLVLGARWLVDGAVFVVRVLGVSELIIGLTLIAVGTSLPEAATSVVAALREERDIAVGNAIGSCIFNLLVVLGLTSLLAPQGMSVAPAALAFDIPIMIAASAATLPIFFIGYRIARWEGALLLAYYAAYMVYLLLNAAHHNALSAFRTAMILFILPLTALTWLTLAARQIRAQRRQ